MRSPYSPWGLRASLGGQNGNRLPVAMTYLATALTVVSLARTAVGFQIRTGFTVGCHEGMAFTAYEQSGLTLQETAIALPRDDTWQELADFLFADLALRFEEPRQRFFFFSLLAGVRSPDTDGHSALNLLSLRRIHDDPAGQYDHCLRAAGDDGLQGDVSAQAGCLGFIREEMRAAVRLLELPPAEQNLRTSFTLDFYGNADTNVWGPIFHLARASHALQDSFSHTVRGPDLKQIYSFMNYAEAVGGSLKAERDGLAHSDHADRCDDDLRTVPAAAVDATADLFRAVASYIRSGSERHFEAFANKWLNLRPGCGPENNYCESPWLERARKDPSGPILGCSFVSGDGGPGVVGLCLLLLLLAGRSRRKCDKGWCTARPGISILLLFTQSVACGVGLERRELALGIVYPVGGKGDLGFADSVASAVNFARWQLSLDLQEFEPRSAEQAREALDGLLASERPAELVVAVGFDYQQTIARRDCAFGGATVLFLDGNQDVCDNLRSVRYRTFVPAFLAGVVAIEKLRLMNARRLAEGKPALALRAAAFGGVDIPAVREFLDGFSAGVVHTGGELSPIEFLAEDTSGFSQVDAARTLALRQLEGARVLFPVAGRAVLGAIQAASQRHEETGDAYFVIGVDADLSPIAPEVVLASVLKRLDRSVREALFTFVSSQFEPGDFTLGAGQGYTQILVNLLHEETIATSDGAETLLLSQAVEAARTAAQAAATRASGL